MVPGNPALIHHVLLMQVDGSKVSDMAGGKTNGEIMQALDDGLARSRRLALLRPGR